MSLIPATMLGEPAASFDIPNSGLFAEEDSPNLTLTLGTATDQKISTISLWTKRSATSRGSATSDEDWIISAGSASRVVLRFLDDDLLIWSMVVGGTAYALKTTRAFRDIAEWYHIVVVMDTPNATSGDRLVMYINGERITDFVTETYPVQNDVPDNWNEAIQHKISGISSSTTRYVNGYLSEFYFIDGQALGADDFAETDATTGQWVPKEYAGTYGNNGSYLNFSNGSDLGEDSSGNANDWTNSNVIQSTDTPTDNHCTINKLGLLFGSANYILRDAGKQVDGLTTVDSSFIAGTFRMTSGKWYYEATPKTSDTAGYVIGITGVPRVSEGAAVTDTAWYLQGGGISVDNVAQTTASSYTINDVIGVALDIDSLTIQFYKNNTAQGSAYTINSGVAWAMFTQCKEGNMDFAFAEDEWTYAAPSGFLAMSSKNLPTPDITLSGNQFKTILYDDGTGAKTVGFQPDLVWFKARGAAVGHRLVDSVRGVQLSIASNAVSAEITESTGLTSFDTNGFTVGADTNYSNTTGVGMVAYSWKEGVTPGFDILQFSGTGSAHTESHSLSAVPEVMIFKNLDTTNSWRVYHHKNTSAPETDYLVLNDNVATVDDVNQWNDTAPTSTQLSVGISAGTNGSGTDNIIAYLFAGIDGFSKFDGYLGNGSANGPFIHCGFKPAFIMIKRTNGAYAWQMFDSERDPENVSEKRIYANLSDVESTALTNELDILSNGFKLRSLDAATNTGAGIYVYMAFAESPFKHSRAR